jgi:hypothetical protein
MEARVDEGLRTETLGRGEAIVDIVGVRIKWHCSRDDQMYARCDTRGVSWGVGE